MPLPWQHTFYHCQKMCLAHLHPKANICAKFHENWWKTEEVVRDARFSPNFCHNMPLPWQQSFCHCRKMCLAHLHPKANICAQFYENWSKTEEVVRDARFFPHFCHNMPLPWQQSFCHCRKMCLAHLHPKANICAQFYENWSKTEEVVRDARFFPHFCHNMPLPWQQSFCHCRKMCLAHLHPKANICAQFYENWSKTEEVVRDARLATDWPDWQPTDRIGNRPTARRHADSYIPPLYTTCMRGYNNNNNNNNNNNKIFTIFIYIFIMMNSMLSFIWGLVSTMLEHHILYTLNSSRLLHSEIFSVEPCPKSPPSSGWLWTHQHIYGFPK